MNILRKYFKEDMFLYEENALQRWMLEMLSIVWDKSMEPIFQGNNSSKTAKENGIFSL